MKREELSYEEIEVGYTIALFKSAYSYADMLNAFWDSLDPDMPAGLAEHLTEMFFNSVLQSEVIADE